MSPYIMSLLLSSLSLGTIITMSSNHWFLAWVGLELNTLAIMPLMSEMHHPRATEAATKYFLTQSMASAILLFAVMLNAWNTGEWTIMSMQASTPMIMLTIALMIKLAVAPFHLWLSDVIQGLNLMTCLIMLTWQKLAPLALLIQVSHEMNSMLLISMGALSLLVGGWGGLNQLHMRKIMAFSSIAHLGWMIIVTPYMPNLTQLNLLMYLLMTSSLFLTVMTLQTTTMNKMASSWMKNFPLLSTTTIIFMSLGGLPPMSGFLPKWMILEELVKQNMTPLAVLAVALTLLTLFFYLRLSYVSSLTTSPSPLNSKLMWRLKLNLNLAAPPLIVASTMLLPISPSIINLT
uniref:NADH-ubiquinone oxidoreductase chain 2 n=1 Tax=Plethodon metcalfi TaxID=315414 RepID=Q52WS5_9SALA|nr:NADH dehydrogenase subunit II [Plethodon metcalfi]AAX89199.1 NADH dehydrogenase subunit II [Plethodon metcalfi]AAX89206.1 NADH dehydrogenase subunit II [Plethodon metcalfi]AAX89207.1 NADH dehydrogenase subunit II [Plethodon metcalfi]